MSEADDPIVNSCPTCGELIDVTKEEPFSKIPCPHCGNPLRVRCDFDQFLIRKAIGEGGMSRVFLAEDTKLQRNVALKILNQRYGKDEHRVAQFENEARLTAQINHPHVVRVYSVGQAQGYFYIAMELIGGGTLEERITQNNGVSEEEVLRIGGAVCQGLLAAQHAGLVHRDIKPGNILFSEDNEPKIVDFGLALMTQESDQSEEIWATPFYVPPEKLSGHAEDFRGDMYSLGATLFHAAAGHPPHAAHTASLDELREIKQQPVDIGKAVPSFSQGGRLVINRMLEISPDDRWQSYEENISAFGDASALLRTGGTLPLTRRRSFWAALGAAAAVLAAVITLQMRKPENVSQAEDFLTGGDEAVVEDVQMKFVNARLALTSGHIEDAEKQFRELAAGNQLTQPALNWARVNQALASLFMGRDQEAYDVIRAVQENAYYSGDQAHQINVGFFARLSQDLLAPKPLPVPAITSYRTDSMESLGLIANGLRHLNQGNLGEAKAILEYFLKSNPPETLAYINDYKADVSKAVADIAIIQSARARPVVETDTQPVAEEKIRDIEESIQKMTYRSLGQKVLKSHLDEQRVLLARIAKRSALTRLAQQQELKTMEFEVFSTLCGSAAIYQRSGQFARGAEAFASTAFSSPEIRQAADDMRYLWANAAEFLTLLARDISTIGYKGEIPRIGKTALYGQLLTVSAEACTVRVYSSPDALESSGDVTVPVTDLSPDAIFNVARRIAASIPDSTEYYKRLISMVCYARLTRYPAALDLQQTLLNENREFRKRWTRIQEYDVF